MSLDGRLLLFIAVDKDTGEEAKLAKGEAFFVGTVGCRISGI